MGLSPLVVNRAPTSAQGGSTVSSYFDRIASRVFDADEQHPTDEGFLAALTEIEGELFRDVTQITGDREFPDDLREKMLGVLAVHAVYQPEGVLTPERARVYAVTSRYSLAAEKLHDLHHELASRRIPARFGRWTDSPTQNRVLRDEHDEEVR